MSQNDKYKVNGVQSHPKRVPLHRQKVLDALNEPGKKRYWMGESAGRREQFELAGWHAVQDKNADTSDKDMAGGRHAGSEVRRTVNKGVDATFRTSVLMEIDEDLYMQDFEDQQKMIDRSEEGLDPAKNPGFQKSSYGSLKKELE